MTTTCKTNMKKLFEGVSTETITDLIENMEYLRKTSKTFAEFEKRVKKFEHSTEMKMYSEVRDTLEDAAKKGFNDKFVRQKEFKNDPVGAIESIYSVHDAPIKHSGNTIEFNMRRIEGEGFDILVQDLVNTKLIDIAGSDKLALEVLKESYSMQGKGKSSTSPEAKSLFKTYSKVYNLIQNEMELAGSNRGKLEGYLRRKYDASKVELLSPDEWRSLIHKNVNLKESFDFGTKDADMIHKEIDAIKESIVDSKYNPTSIVRTKQGGSTIKNRGSFGSVKSRKLVFNNAEAEFEFMNAVGKGTQLDGVMDSLVRDAKTAATMDRLGSNPWNAHETLKAEIGKSLRGNEKLHKKFKQHSKRIDQLFEDTVVGIHSGSSRAAVFFKHLKSWTAMSKLGATGPRAAAADFATQVAVMSSRTSQGFFESMWKSFKAYTKTLKADRRIELAKAFQMYTGGQLGEFHNRFNPDDILEGRASKMNNFFYKINGMHPTMNMAKLGNADVAGVHLAAISKKSFENLHVTDRINLEKYGFEAKDWELAKGAIEDVDGTKVMTLYGVDKLGLDPRTTRNLKMKLSSYLKDGAEYLGNPNPNIKERGLFKGGTDPDSPAGILVDLVSQFKNFGLAMNRVAKTTILAGMGEVKLKPGESMPTTVTGALKTKVGIQNFAKLFVGTTVMAGAATVMLDVATGRDRDYGADFWLDNIIRGGSLGLYMDFIGADYGMNSSLGDMVAGPVIGGVGKDLGRLKSDPSGLRAFRTLINNSPFLNLFYLQAAMRYFIVDNINEQLSPGYKERLLKRREREANK